MMNRFWRIAWLPALVLGTLVCIFRFEGPGITDWGNRLKLGIDLSGGTILVYEVKEQAQTDSQTMDALIGALKKRVNPEGVLDIPIRRVGSKRLEIILAEATPEAVERLKRKITEVGALEFRILATYKTDLEAIEESDDKGVPEMFTSPPSDYRWYRVGERMEGGVRDDGTAIPGTSRPEIVSATEIKLPGRTLRPHRYKEAFLELRSGEQVLRFKVLDNTESTLTLTEPHGATSLDFYNLIYNPGEIVESGRRDPQEPAVREWPRGQGLTEMFVLAKLDRQNVTGEYLSRVFPEQDQAMQPAIGFTFEGRGARRFGELTGSHLPEEGGRFQYRLAVILDGMVRSAPNIRAEIRDRGIIEGVAAEEVPLQIEIMQSGSLPASIDPVPKLEEKIGPTLGRDTIAKGVRAILISLAAVPLFMILFYHFAGVVAVIALLLNMLLLVATMALTGSSFTLPGLAGLALTIGMAVDANVLIFERMREEKERGATLAQQIRNGFDKAWSTILDSNVTGILSGLVLWFVGTEEVKGFALTLVLGLAWNMFTAVVVSRAIFELSLDSGWLKRLTMVRVLDKTNIDFVAMRRYCWALSLVLIVAGMGVLFSKGQSMLNIDFTGGTLVSLRLDAQGQVNGKALAEMSPAARSAYVRRTAGEVLPNPSIETLTLADTEGPIENFRFNIRTTNDKVDEVQQAVIKAFGDTLDKTALSVSEAKPIVGPDAAAAPAAGDDAAAKTPAVPTVRGDRFAGGNLYEMQFNRSLDVATVRDKFAGILEDMKVEGLLSQFEIQVAPGQNAPETDQMVLRTLLPADTVKTALDQLDREIETDASLLFDRLENFGGAVAGETRSLALVAIVLSWVMIIVYLWFRFKSFGYGLAAVIALVHDVLIALAAVAISPYKIDLPMIAAFLTLIGFSVNDTIVIFDRIREIKGKSPQLTPALVNAAINQTLSRTILVTLTSWMVVVIFYLFGGEGLRGFSFCLVVGFISGVYSTLFIAAPILIEWSGTMKPSAATGKKVTASSEVV